MTILTTKAPYVLGRTVYHLLQGGGKGMQRFAVPYYIQGVTWCGVEKYARREWLREAKDLPRNAKICRRCQRAKRSQSKAPAALQSSPLKCFET